MEGNSTEVYVRSILDIEPAEERASTIFKNIFTTPLPYSGASACPLRELPKGADGMRVLTTAPINLTTWNTQIHEILVSFGARKHATRVTDATGFENRAAVRDPTPVILTGAALASALAVSVELSSLVIQDIRNEKRWLTSTGTVLKRLPKKITYRSSAYTGAALTRFRSTSAPPSANTSPPPAAYQDAISGPESITEEEAPPTGIPKEIPVRVVEPTLASVQGQSPVGVPKTQAYLGLEQYASERGSASQGLVPGTRSVLARDTPSVSFLVSYMDGSNASFIDTAPILRALLYIFPNHIDAWQFSRLDRQFIRQQVNSTRSDLTFRIAETPAADRLQLLLLAVTLPAYAAYLKGLDTILGSQNPAINAGFHLSTMDSTWTVVPIDSATLHAPWLMEFIVAFLSTAYWNGRSNWIWSAQYQDVGNERSKAYFTTIPAAHNVHVPGPTRVMLVLVEDSGFASTNTISLPNYNRAVNVYPGSRTLPNNVANLGNYLVNLTDVWYNNTFTTENYGRSAQNMLHALNYMEKHVSTNMAFAAAVTLASELSSTMPEGMSIQLANDSRTYLDHARGAWTFGSRNLATRAPRLTTNDIYTGTIEHRETNFSKMVAAYSYSMLSPCLQYAASSSTVVSANAIRGEEYLGKLIRWSHPKPTYARAQYTCHVSHSAYRVMRVLGYIPKNDYTFTFVNIGGLQNTLTNNGVMLTASLSLAMIRNDIALSIWTGLGADDLVAAHMSVRSLVSNWTNNMIRLRHPNEYFDTTVIDGDGGNVDQAFDHYYGSDSTDPSWATHIPMPINVLMQWAMKCEINLANQFEVKWGRVTANLQTRYCKFTADNRSILPVAAATGDVHRTAPACYELRAGIASRGIPMYIDEWSEMTSGMFDMDVSSGRYQSNILANSMRYHYQDSDSDAQVYVLSDLVGSRLSMAHVLAVDPLIYPDPPNPSVFQVGPNGGALPLADTTPPPQDRRQETTNADTSATITLPTPPINRVQTAQGVVQSTSTGPAQSQTGAVTLPGVAALVQDTPTINPTPASTAPGQGPGATANARE